MSTKLLLDRIRELRKATVISNHYQRGVIRARLKGNPGLEQHYIELRDEMFRKEVVLLLSLIEVVYDLNSDSKNHLIRTLNEEIILWSDRVSGFVPRTPDGLRSSKLF